jgi:hypothetical protein
MTDQVDVLNLEWTSAPSRDRQAASLVCNYLRIRGYRVVEGSVFRGVELLVRYRPKLFFIVDTIGAPVNARLMRYAKAMGIPGVSLISEGIFKAGKEDDPNFFWGWNRDRCLYQLLHLQWSQHSRQLTVGRFPSLSEKIKVSGAVGFDVYRIAQFKTREAFLGAYGKGGFERVIGFAGWDFGPCYPGNARYEDFAKALGLPELERLRKDAELLNKALLSAIIACPDILFLIKEHPGALHGKQASAAEGCEAHPNVLYLKNEESLADCINVSDAWFSYESTTALEAWLLDTPTGLINPTGTDFPFRDDIHHGSPNFETAEALIDAIQRFYAEGSLSGFDPLSEARADIVRRLIQWDDGLNHVRAGNAIAALLPTHEKRDRLPVPLLYWLAREKLYWITSSLLRCLPRFGQYYRASRRWNEGELADFATRRRREQEQFYARLDHSTDSLRLLNPE